MINALALAELDKIITTFSTRDVIPAGDVIDSLLDLRGLVVLEEPETEPVDA